MKSRRLLGLILVLVMAITAVGCTTVPPGEAGIKVNRMGSDRGVEDFPVSTGWVWFNPFTTSVIKYPTFLQTKVWTADDREGSRDDEHITFNSSEGATIQADIALSYSFVHEAVPALFVEFRQPAKAITDGYMRVRVRDAFSRVASQMEAPEIIGPGKQLFLDSVMEILTNELGPKGISIDIVSFIGEVRLSPLVRDSIDAVIEANQAALEAQNRVLQAQAEAEQRVKRAQGEAEAVLTIAQAQAEANILIANSLTPALVEYQKVVNWDGALPKFTGGDGGPIALFQIPDDEFFDEGDGYTSRR